MGCCFSAPDDDAAAGELDPVSGTHQFTIRHYSQTKGIGSGKSILSRYFTVDGRTWYARFYPDGYTQNSQFVAFYVQTLYKPQCRAVRARFVFELLKPDGSVGYSRRSDRPCKFDRYCNSWGFRAFVTREALEGAQLGVLHEDSIKVRCTVEVVNSRRKGRGGAGGDDRARVGRAAAMAPQSDFAANSMRFFTSGRAPFDVKFDVDGTIFEAHGLVVAAQSEWFAAALYGHGHEEKWAEAGMPSIPISDTSPEAFEGVLHYIYQDELPEELIKANGEAEMTRQLFEAADMFLIERMKRMCASRLRGFIKDDTVRDIMDLAKAHSCKELEQACQTFLGRRRA
ncbi:BTB/POZ and MATH domain-containing protein 1 [Dichanthelium oligosanthes]|uniref:BTB/POZ and MATH domain-containing protein 1 n=1 Tax=Dichanthelium oligosanthes TaxID=888268 RepID=A0A1E5VGX9_9POAL|nr:BTB/POZ and MATH domain-containing protein 1 [Dichanthelium oligosanthes]